MSGESFQPDELASLREVMLVAMLHSHEERPDWIELEHKIQRMRGLRGGPPPRPLAAVACTSPAAPQYGQYEPCGRGVCSMNEGHRGGCSV